MNIEDCFEVLEVKNGSTICEIKQAYHDMLMVWHPDRFPDDSERLRKKAEEKAKVINEAYTKILAYLETQNSNNPNYKSPQESQRENEAREKARREKEARERVQRENEAREKARREKEARERVQRENEARKKAQSEDEVIRALEEKLEEQLTRLKGRWWERKIESYGNETIAQSLDPNQMREKKRNDIRYAPKQFSVSELVERGFELEISDLVDMVHAWKPNNTEPDLCSLGDGKTVWSKACGLIWERSGSIGQLGFFDAQKYIDKLNKCRFCGADNWRVPTIEELSSLFGYYNMKWTTPEYHDREPCAPYISKIFDYNKLKLWSCDLASAGEFQCEGDFCGVKKRIRIKIPHNCMYTFDYNDWRSIFYSSKNERNYAKAVRSV
jgi:curved DNA-binding protein CbpA